MRQYWDDKEVPGRGIKYCLVIDPEDGTHPIRTYGWDKEEVLGKVARTAGTAQALISQQRAAAAKQQARETSATAQPEATPKPPTSASPSAEEVMAATADLSNPAKAPQATRVLLMAAGVNVDAMALREAANLAGAVAQEWERANPDFPDDGNGKNHRLMMDRAVLLANGKLGDITLRHLDQAYQYLLAHDLLWPAAVVTEESHASNGNSDSRGEGHRSATSYRRNTLSTPVPAARKPKPKYTPEQIDALDSKQLRDKIDNEPGFAEELNRGDYSRQTATA